MTRARVLSVARVERRKLRAQAPLRVLALAGLAGPFAFALVLKLQNGTPADALFGTWVHQSGGALSLVVLSFAANWGFPVIAGVMAGDLFASEDRHGTWKTVLTRSRSLRDVFAGKVLAAFGYALALALLVAAASVVAGVAVVGTGALADFGGRLLDGGGLLWRVVLAWLMCLPAVLAYGSLAVLFSVASRSGIIGVLGPVIVALLTQLLGLIGKGVIVHMLLIGTAFEGWHGLFADGVFLGPWLVSLLVCAAWVTGCLAVSWRILRRREFVAGGERRGSPWVVPVRVGAGAVALIALLALASSWGPAGITGPRLRGAMLAEFRRLAALQQDLLGHPIPATAHYRILPVCNKRGAAPVGPGDWACTMNVYVVLPGAQHPLTNTPVAYDVSVQSTGCFKASSPPNYVGAPIITDTRGRRVVNPLVVVYGCFDIL